MKQYVAKRLLIVVVSLFGLVTVSFGLVSLIPGDPASVILGDYRTPEAIAEVHAKLGLDEPFHIRYWNYVSRTARGDLGESYFTAEPVADSILVRLPSTLVLLIPGLLLAILIGLVVGSLGAFFRGRMPDKVVGVGITSAQAIPEFVVGLLLLFFFFGRWGIAPAPIGMLDPIAVPPRQVTGSPVVDAVVTGDWSSVGSIATHSILPVVTIAIFLATYFAKTTRTGLTESYASPQVEFARACGLRERTVYWYALTSVRTSLLTYLVILFGAALGGAAIVENVFSWPGVGNWSLEGVIKGDIPVIQGFVLVMGAATLLMYVLLDVTIMLLDPRVRRP